MKKPRGFRATELRLTGAFLARRWVAQVATFPTASGYLSWFANQQLSGPARREFIEFAAGAIRNVSPLGRLAELDVVLSSLYDSLISFQESSERCWSWYVVLIVRLKAVVTQMCVALAQFGFNQKSAANPPPNPWLRMEEAEAVALKLEQYVMPWDDLEQALGLEAGSLSRMVKVSGQHAEHLTSGRPNAQHGGHISVAVQTPSAVGPNPGLLTGVDKPSHSPVQKPAPSPSDLSFSERLLEAVAVGIIKTGTLVYLRTSPIAFLLEVPVLHGGLVDEFPLKLYEYAARLSAASGDRQHPKARSRYGRPSAGKRKVNHSRLWSKISKEFAVLRQKLHREHPPGFLALQDYLGWPGRRTPWDVATSDGVVLASLLDWISGELQGAQSQLHQSGSADAAKEATGETGTADGHDLGVADKLAIALAKQARSWFSELEMITVQAEKVKLWYMGGQAEGETALKAAFADKQDLLGKRIQVLSTFCVAILQLVSIPRSWASADVPKDLGLFFGPEGRVIRSLYGRRC